MDTAREELVALIEAKGQEIRTLKSEGTPKDALKPHIDELLILKAKFQTVTGEAYVAPGQEKKSKPSKVPPEPTALGAEPVDPNKKSKKQMQREKKEAEKAAAKAKAKEEREKKQAEAAAKGAVGERYVPRGARGDGPQETIPYLYLDVSAYSICSHTAFSIFLYSEYGVGPPLANGTVSQMRTSTGGLSVRLAY